MTVFPIHDNIIRILTKLILLVSLVLLLLFGNTSIAKPTILIWGDSLSAAYGMPIEKGWVHLMKQRLAGQAEVINGSISGETTQGGLTRLPQALADHQANIVLIELGANDGLRGLPPALIEANLQKMITLITAKNAQVILLGMKIPPNYGLVYTQKFTAVFSNLAQRFGLLYVPFFLEDINEQRDLLQEDDFHPNAAAQVLLLEKILPIVTIALVQHGQ